MNNAILENVQTVDSEKIIPFSSAKRFKMKQQTYNAIINFKPEEKHEEQNDELLNKKIEILANECLSEMKKEYPQSIKEENVIMYKPIKIKHANNIRNIYDGFINKKEDEFVGVPVDLQDSNTIESTLEFVQQQQINELLSRPMDNVNIEEKEQQDDLYKTLEFVQQQQINELLNNPQKLEKIKSIDPTQIGYSVEEIQNLELAKMLKSIEDNRQMREEIQIVPERYTGFKDTIDNEFYNQGQVQQISREEVEKTVNNGKDLDETEISQAQEIDEEEMTKSIQESISAALRKLEENEKNEKNKKKESKLNIKKIPIVSFADIFKSAQNEKNEETLSEENNDDYEISQSIREQISSKLNEKQEEKPVIVFSNDTTSNSKIIDFSTKKDLIAKKQEQLRLLQAKKAKIQANNEEMQNKVEEYISKRDEAEAKVDEYLRKLEEQEKSYNSEIATAESKNANLNDRINAIQRETDMYYGLIEAEEEYGKAM